jgi:hypothetical protein
VGGEAAAPNGGGTLPVMRLSSRLPASVLAREESFGSRRWTDVAANAAPAPFQARAASLGERPEWQVEAHLRLNIGSGHERLRRTGYVAASLAALVIGLGAGVLLRTGVGSGPARSTAPASNVGRSVPSEAAHAPLPSAADGAAHAAPAVEVDELALAALAVPLPGPPIASGQAALAEPQAPVRDMPAPMLARLESIVALDGVRRASFRVGDRSIALVEGDEIGGRAVVAIANDEVTLAGGGTQRRVRLGFETPLE